jgi:hypothetical protein
VVAVHDHVEPDIEYTRSPCSRRKTEFRLPEAYGKSSDALLNQVTQTKHRINDCSIFLPEERADTYRQQGEKIDRQSYLFCPFSWSYLLTVHEPTNSCRIHGPPRKRVQHQGLAPLFFQQRLGRLCWENTTGEKHRPCPGCQSCKSWDARQGSWCRGVERDGRGQGARRVPIS